VISTFDRLLGEGVDGDVTGTIIGPKGVAVLLHVQWPNPGEGRGVNFYHAYVVHDGVVTEIHRHDDRRSAVAAVRLNYGHADRSSPFWRSPAHPPERDVARTAGCARIRRSWHMFQVRDKSADRVGAPSSGGV